MPAPRPVYHRAMHLEHERPPGGPSLGARRLWLCVLLALLAVVSHLAFSTNPPRTVDTGWDKSNHLLAFAALTLAAEFAFWPWPRRRLCNAAWLMAYGAVVELVQSRIPGRSGEWPDLLADAAGIALGLAAAALALGLQRWLGLRARVP